MSDIKRLCEGSHAAIAALAAAGEEAERRAADHVCLDPKHPDCVVILRAGMDALDAHIAALTRQNEALQREIDGLRRLKASVDEALNMGDGVYRP